MSSYKAPKVLHCKGMGIGIGMWGCRSTIFNERRPARHGQWRSPRGLCHRKPDGRHMYVFGKSVLGDGGVKCPPETLSRRLLHPRETDAVQEQSGVSVRHRYGGCRGTIFNERRPARHGQWRTPWIVSPEARWPTHRFGKSFLGDWGVKHSRECVDDVNEHGRARCMRSQEPATEIARQRQAGQCEQAGGHAGEGSMPACSA